MKKIITLLAAVAFTATAFSQIGAHLGGNVSTLRSLKDATFENYKLGYQVGFSKDLGNWGERFSVEPGVFLINKGGRAKITEDKKSVTNLNYLQVPLNTKINFYFGATRIFIGYGIYGSCGLWANTKFDGKKTAQEFGKNHPFVRFDIGSQVFAGVMAGRVGMNLQYQFGGRSIYHGGNTTNKSIMLNLSYLFSDPAQ